MIRQSILCHGDISLLYWWNHNYTYVDGDGIKHYTEDYLSRTPEQRATGTFATWDTAVQCRDLNSINTWIDAHAMDNDKYGGTEIG
jgi:Mycotoxin biosynthesis protein UstYa